MMTPAQNSTAPAPKPDGKNGSRTDGDGGSLKTPSAAAARARQPHQPAGIKCPRCNSPNTKFCYYNNYNPAQPRHFCKTCRRYWTKGGSLRNIPIGGGSRQSKKTTASFTSSTNDGAGMNENGLRFFQGLSPAMDFQLDYYGAHLPPEPNPTSGFLSQLSSSFRDLSANSDGLVSAGNPNSFATVLNPDSGNESPTPPLGFSFPLYYQKEGGTGVNTLGFQDVGPSLGSSMESMSYVNQDLHLKSQQQRLGLVFVGDYSNDNNYNNRESNLVPSSSAGAETLAQRPQPFWYKNMEISSADESCTVYGSSSSKHDGINGDLSTEWLFSINNNNNKNNNNSYAAFHEDQTQQITASDDNSNSEKSSRNWRGFQAWTGLG